MGGWDAPWHWVVLAILVIALFGYKKLPDAARAMGRSLRIFKTEIKGMSEDDKARQAANEAAQPQPVRPAVEGVPPTVAPGQTTMPGQSVPQGQPAAPPSHTAEAPAASTPPYTRPVTTPPGNGAGPGDRP